MNQTILSIGSILQELYNFQHTLNAHILKEAPSKIHASEVICSQEW